MYTTTKVDRKRKNQDNHQVSLLSPPPRWRFDDHMTLQDIVELVVSEQLTQAVELE